MLPSTETSSLSKSTRHYTCAVQTRSLSRTRGGHPTNGIKHTAGASATLGTTLSLPRRRERHAWAHGSGSSPTERLRLAEGRARTHNRPGSSGQEARRCDSAAEAAGKAEDGTEGRCRLRSPHGRRKRTRHAYARTPRRGTCKRAQAGCGTSAVASRDSLKMNEKSAAVAGSRVRQKITTRWR